MANGNYTASLTFNSKDKPVTFFHSFQRLEDAIDWMELHDDHVGIVIYKGRSSDVVAQKSLGVIGRLFPFVDDKGKANDLQS